MLVGEATPEVPLAKPWFRGRLHEAAFIIAVPAGVVLVALAPDERARVAALIFGSGLALLYGASAAYHRGDWSPRALPWLKRLDHWMIFVLIAASYTPFCLLVMSAPWSWLLLSIVWTGAVAGIVLKAVRIDGFHGLTGALYVTLGWIGILMAPAMISRLTPAV